MSDLDRSISGLSKRDVASSSRSESGRPSRIPEDKDDFKKMVDRRRQGSGSQQEDDDEDALPNTKTGSIFDIAAKKSVQEQAGQSSSPSPFDLAQNSKMKSNETAAIAMDTEASADMSGLPVDAKPKGEEAPIVKGRTFEQVREDISHVNPQHLTLADAKVPVAEGGKPSVMQSLQTLVDQIVDKLYTVKMGNITDTVMTIKNPPVFAGAELVVTSYDFAKGEFNIAFANLSQEAKQLLDSQQANLMAALERNGYVAHIVVTSTEPYARQTPEAPTIAQGQQQQQQQQREEQSPDQRRQRRGQQQQG